MKNRPLLHIVLGLSWLTLVSCGSETTEPNAAPTSAGPELAVGSGTWLTRANMPGIERWAFALAPTKNAEGQSILYAIGGEIPYGPTLGTVHAYNVATNTWSRKPDMPAALASSMAGVINGKIYVAGGTPTNRNRGPSSSLFVYDPATNVWTQKRNMPEGGAGRVAVSSGASFMCSPHQTSSRRPQQTYSSAIARRPTHGSGSPAPRT
jgi:N-acetylneuraminic acid mutarotase